MKYKFPSFIKNFVTDYNELVKNGSKYNNSKSFIRKMESRGGTWYVKFFKVDGSVREMLCTRDWNKLLKDKNTSYEPPSGYGRTIPTHQVIVWDLRSDGYRSFRANSVIKFQFISPKLVKAHNDKIKYSKDELIKKLDSGNYKIIFTKKDGTKRSMNCTRNIKDFNDDYSNNENLIRVWDLDKDDYRTIIYSNILLVLPSNKQFKSNNK